MASTKRSRYTMAILVVVAMLVAGSATALLTRSDADSVDAASAGKPADNIVQAGAPGEASRKLTGEEAAERTEPPSHTDADIAFAQGMVHHHEQALQMVGWVLEQSVGSSLPLLAERMRLSQEAEIEVMTRWLEARAKQAHDLRGPGHAIGIPGMLTDAQIASLEEARGRAFNRRFLQLMIRHHQGALLMVHRLRSDGGGLEPEMDKLAREIEADQNVEIQRMRELLAGRTEIG